MNLASLTDLVCQKVGKVDAASIDFCKKALRQRHELIYDSCLWKDTVVPFEATAGEQSGVVVLPFDLARPIAVWDLDRGLPVNITSLVTVAITNPNALTDMSGLMAFTEIDSVGWPYDMGNGAKLQFDHFGNTGETTVNLSGWGKTIALPLLDATSSESLTMAGQGAIVLSSFWGRIDRMSKAQTLDALIVNQVGGPFLQWVWPADSTEAVFARIRLVSPSKSAVALGVLGKRKLRQMRLDTDSAMIRGIDNVLLAFAQGDMLERSRQYNKAASAFQAAAGMLQIAKDSETNQSASEARIIPEVYAEEGEL